MIRWYEFRRIGSDGGVIEKGRTENEARRKAADRMECGENEIYCIGHTPFNAYLTAGGRYY